VSDPKIPDLPDVGSTPDAWMRFMGSVREVLQVREGRRGNVLDEGVTFRDLVDLGIVERGAAGGWTGGAGTVGPAGPPGVQGPPGTPYVPDYTAPPTPTGLTATSMFRGAYVEWDAPTYTQGHGNAYTKVYVAQYGGSGPLPTFASAIATGQAGATTSMYVHNAPTGTQLHFWVAFVSVDGVESAVPAGGLNGAQITIGTVGNVDLGPLIVEAGNLASGAVTASKLAAAAVELTKFASGIEPVTIATGVPGVYAGTKSLYDTVTGKLYRWNGSAYVATVPTVDLTGQITTTQITDSAITTDKLLANAVTTAKLAAGAVTANELAANSVVAGKVAAGAISTAQLVAGAVTTDKLLVRGSQALNADPGCADASAWWLANITIEDNPSSPYGGSTLECGHATPATSYALSLPVPVDASKNYLARILAKQSGGAGTCYLTVAFLDASGTNISGGTGWPATGTYFYFGLTNDQPPGAWTEYSIAFGPNETAKIPAGAVYVQIGVLGNYVITSAPSYQSFAGLRITEKAGADLIVDGSIIATKIAANAIAVGTAAIQNGAIVNAMIANAAIDDAKIANLSAAKITAGTLDAARIGVGTLDADRLVSGSITATQLSSGAVTAGKINVANLAAINADLGTITAGSLTLNTAGYVRAGQTAFDTGAGFWLGYSGGAYRFSIGDGSKALLWDGTNLSVRGAIVGNTNLSGGITYDKIDSVSASTISTGTLNADRIAASSITAAKLSVTSLSSVSADLGSITAGTITLDSSGHVKGGQTAYNTGTGFFLGYSGAAYKFSIGNPSGNYLTWDGTTLSVSMGAVVMPGITISGLTDIGGSVVHGSDKLLGTRTATVSGGYGTLTYQWYLSWKRNTPTSLNLYLTGAQTASCSVYASSSAAGNETDAELVCVVTDQNNRSAVGVVGIGVVFT